MALICNCRGIGERAITLYFKNRQGEAILPKDVFNACRRGSTECCERKSDCNTVIKDMVKVHNAAITQANDAQAHPANPGC